MSNHQHKPHLFDNPANVRWLVRGLTALCIVLFGLDVVLHRHAEHPWEGVFGFYPLYGFVACVLLVLLAKELRKLVMRGEDYYRDAPNSNDHEVGNTSDPSTDKRGSDD
ncbi:MAG: hypothetical protein V7707_17495 [Motiliproteus sp.]